MTSTMLYSSSSLVIFNYKNYIYKDLFTFVLICEKDGERLRQL